MASKKPKTTKKSTSKPKAAEKAEAVVSEKTETVVKTEKTVNAPKNTKKTNVLSGFFAKKYEQDESILTIFKNPRFYGALTGELIGSALLTMLFITLSLMGIVNLNVYGLLGLVAIIVAVYKISGANLNPIVTVGMMATRRMSVIRGVFYIIAQIVGAWVGLLVINGFRLATDSTTEMPAMTAIATDGETPTFWITVFIELLGAIIIAFGFARALSYKRSALTFAMVVTGSIAIAVLVGYIVSAAFADLSNNFIMNPAMALMYQIFPTVGESFGEIMGGICIATLAYVIFPMIGGVAGFYLSDFASKLSGEEQQA